ncbi:hypothetical protein D3C79_941640 [compost metagenome]
MGLLAVAVHQRYTWGAVGLVLLIVDAETHQGGIGDIGFDHTVDNVLALAVPVHERVVILLGCNEAATHIAAISQRPGHVRFQAVVVP